MKLIVLLTTAAALVSAAPADDFETAGDHRHETVVHKWFFPNSTEGKLTGDTAGMIACANMQQGLWKQWFNGVCPKVPHVDWNSNGKSWKRKYTRMCYTEFCGPVIMEGIAKGADAVKCLAKVRDKNKHMCWWSYCNRNVPGACSARGEPGASSDDEIVVEIDEAAADAFEAASSDDEVEQSSELPPEWYIDTL